MGGEGGEEGYQGFHIASGAAVLLELAHQGHHGGDGGVELHGLDIIGYLFDGLVDGGLVGGGVIQAVRAALRQVPHLVQKALAALDRLVRPHCGLFKVADEHDVQAQGVRAVGLHNIVRIDHIPPGLGHFLPTLAQDHAVAGALLVGLLGGRHADVVQEFVPEPGVEQVEGGVLHAAVIPVYRGPVVQRLLGGQGIAVVGVHIPQEVPGGARPLGHGVGFPLGGAAAAGAGGLDPVGHLGQGGFAVVGGLVGLHLREEQGQLALGQRLPAALVAVHHGDGLAPVTLAGEHPVPQLVVDLGRADALLLQPLCDGGDGVLDGEAVEEVGIDQDARLVLGGEGGLLHVLAAGHHLDDLQAELFGELPVPVVVGRDGHDGPGAIGGQNIVGDEDGDLLPVDGVDAPHAVQLYAGLFLVQLGAFQVGLGGGGFLVGGDLTGIGQPAGFQPAPHQLVLRGEHHIRGAEEGVGPGGEDHDIVPGGALEGDFRAGGAADPIALLDLHPLDEVHVVQIVDEPLGVLGDFQHPLGFLLADDGGAAPLAHPLHHFLIGQHALAGGAPVHRHGGLVGQPLFKQLEENPLGPLVVGGVSGVHHPVPVEAIAQHFQLPGEVLDILLRDGGGMDVVFDGVVLGGQAEGVEPDGIEHVIPIHPLFPGDDIHGGEGAGMAHVEPLAGGVGELDEAVELGLFALVPGGVNLGLLPALVPLGLDGGEIVFQCEHSLG